jgi:hypothetical protein
MNTKENDMHPLILGIIGNPATFWAMAYKLSDTLMMLVEVEALDQLITAPCSAHALAKTLGLQSEPLSKLLDLLVTANILNKDGPKYVVPKLTQAVLPMMILESKVRWWHAKNQSMRNVLKTGIGADPLDNMIDDTFLPIYQKAMAAAARSIALHLFRYGNMSRTGCILDIGGADGALAEQLSLLMPDASFTVIDRPPVRPHFEERIAKLPGSSSKFRFVTDDVVYPDALLQEAKSASSVVISNVLHLLSSAQIKALLAGLRAYLTPGSRLIIYDQFVDCFQLDPARLMVVDWVNLGAGFDLHEHDLEQALLSLGYGEVSARRFTTLPGALVCASIN